MVNSTSDAILADPQAVIQRLFGWSHLVFTNTDAAVLAESRLAMSDFGIPAAFEAAFADSKQLAKVTIHTSSLNQIPLLEKLHSDDMKSGKLVRFLGMIQDTGFSQEIYVGMTKTENVLPISTLLTNRDGHYIGMAGFTIRRLIFT